MPWLRQPLAVLLLIVLFALIFWQFVPKSEVLVRYAPWFLDQVETDNIKSLSIQGIAVRGELRREQTYRTSSGTPVTVRRFSTYLPSEASIEPLVQKLTKHDAKRDTEPVQIEGNPPNSASAAAWIVLLLPTFVILAFIYLLMRRARGS